MNMIELLTFLRELWIVYFVLGIFFIILEIFLPLFILLPIGLGFLATIPLTFFFPFWATLIACSVFSAGAYLLLKRGLRPSQAFALKSGIDRLVGQTAMVVEAIDPKSQTGRIKLYGEEWQIFEADTQIEVGAQVQILEFQGNRVRVEEVFHHDKELEKDFEKRLHTQ